MVEQWAKVPGMNGLLYVSSVGRIRQFNTQKKKWLPDREPTVLRHGYPTVCHQQKIYRVHYLMAISFLGPPPSKDHTVDHIAKYSGDWERERSDNRIENLRWATRAEQRKNQGSSASRVDSKKSSLSETPPSDEEFRNVEGVLVSQYGRTKNKYGYSYTPKPNKSMEYALVGGSKRPVHVLVAKAFPEIVGCACKVKHTVDHINRDKTDNRASNLRWASMSEQQYNTTRKPYTQIHESSRLKVAAKHPDASEWSEYNSCCEASREIERQYQKIISPQSIAQFVKRFPNGGTMKLRQNKGWSFKQVL